MTDAAADHRDAANRHDLAAENHQRAARFWEGRGDRERAQLQHEMAEYERGGAALERRWAELVDSTTPNGTTCAAESVIAHARQGAKDLSAMLTRTATALERTAQLADRHAEVREQAGDGDSAAEERQAAERARTAAERARAQAAEWLKASESPTS